MRLGTNGVFIRSCARLDFASTICIVPTMRIVVYMYEEANNPRSQSWASLGTLTVH